MRTVAVAISVGVFAVSLALPSLLLAQEPEAAPSPAEPPPAAEAPPEEVPPPPAAEDPAPAEAATATQAPAEIETPVARGSISVSMVEYAYSPSSVTISLGDTVTWINNGKEDHTSTGSDFDTGTVAPGGSGSATFSSPGSFPYVCAFHPNMKGTVVVADPSSGTDKPSSPEGIDPTTGAPLGSEAAAVASAGAAGSAGALPASGEAEAPLLILGAGLLGCGLLAAVPARGRARETALWPSP